MNAFVRAINRLLRTKPLRGSAESQFLNTNRTQARVRWDRRAA